LEQLVSAIERGIGNFMRPIQKRRETKADISAYDNWTEAIRRTGLGPKSAELTLGDRATIRLTADSLRQQENRESVAIRAIDEYVHSRTEQPRPPSSQAEIDVEWLDRFWRLAQDVTNTEMQSVWGRILARQAGGPETFSARCLEALSLLSSKDAMALERIAAVTWRSSINNKIDHYVVENLRGGDQSKNKSNERLRKAVGNWSSESRKRPADQTVLDKVSQPLFVISH